MAKLRVKEVAEQQGLNLSSFQRKANIAMRTARRYWYNTRDGNVEGDRLEELSLKLLAQIAKVLEVPTSELIIDDEWCARLFATPPQDTSSRAGC